MEVQNILRKMATGKKVLYSIRNILPERRRERLKSAPYLRLKSAKHFSEKKTRN